MKKAGEKKSDLLANFSALPSNQIKKKRLREIFVS